MDGVEILNTIDYWDLPTILIYILLILLFILSVLYLILYCIEKSIGAAIVSSLCVVFVLYCIIAVSVNYHKFPVCHEVTISDEVKLVEFNERYKIIEQDGKIFTVEERK